MAEKRSGAPLIDLAATAISPALIMLMVGSLVFFLIEVLYRGAYSSRLLYTFFFFTVGAVLIARITIEQGRARAGLYAAALAGSCFVAMLAFVEYPSGAMSALGPVVNIALMALVLWAADLLTWDCTHFDDARKASGRGVLAAIGLDDGARAPGDDEDEDEVELTPKQRKLGWLERWGAYRAERKKRPHTPGTRVLYFALAALPLFALGQSLIPADDSARRSATFFQMAVYIASALALLVTTSLMGLRKYLEERGATISPAQTVSWLVLGGGLILAFVMVGAMLPRPHNETPLVDLGKSRASDRNASKNAQVRDGSSGKGDGAAGKKAEAGAGKNSAKGGEQKGGNGGEKGSGGGKGDSQGGQQKGGESKGGEQGQPKGKGNEQSKSDSKSKDKNDSNKGGPNNAKSGDPNKSSGKESEKKDDKGGEGEEADKAEEGEKEGDSESSSSPPSSITSLLENISGFIKWLVWIVIAVAVVVGLVVFVLKGLAPFTNWARNLLDWLRGLWRRKSGGPTVGGAEQEAAEAEARRPAPFDAYRNPFARGSVEREPSEVVEYTFAAFDGWAWERDLGRKPEETPIEFAVRVGHQHAELDDPGFAVAQLYVRVLYGRRPITAAELKPAEELWDRLEAQPHVARP